MKSSRWLVTALVVAALFAIAPAAQAQTTVMDVQLGQAFTGNIAAAGVDTVEVRFSVAQGAVRIALRALDGSTLRLTLVVLDPSGTPVALGTTQRIRWLPVDNMVHYFTAPTAGTYTAVIGGASGSGSFWARITGTPTVAPQPQQATLSGSVTDSVTGAPIAGAEVWVGSSLFATTDSSGNYSGQLAPGSYSVSFQATGYQTAAQAVDLTAGSSLVLNMSLTPVVAVVVDASASGDAVANGTLTATVDIQIPTGATINSITWTQEYGVPAGLAGADTDTATVTLGTEGAYRDELLHLLSEPPVGEDQLPPNVPLPPGEFAGGLQDRFHVVGINPFALEEAALVVLKVEVDTTAGTASDEVEIHTALPWKWSTGLRNVPIGDPVLMHGKDQGSYDWTLTPPASSAATLTQATSQNPWFTPDIPGRYRLRVTDLATMNLATLDVFAGTWLGMIVGQDINERPVPDTACTVCHDDMDAPDKFTPWLETGHAEIFSDNLNTSTHYGSSCFPCHTVGYDPATVSGGIDEAPDYQDFLGAGLLNNPGDNWTTVLSSFPETALKANIQCENCHGPQDSIAHGFAPPADEPRVSLSADVCGFCHGEPLRHGRFQQWQLSGHANYELAIDEGTSGSCSRCHTANGFLKWLPILLDDDPATDPEDSITVTWTADETHPQTCVACHDPHAEGTTSGDGTNATVRISGDTPPLSGGFQVTDVGRSAICMTCHNSRRGLRNDSTFDDFFGTSEAARAPHGSTQTDVLMGQNAYLVTVPSPGGHALHVEETCIDCHMESTPPPDVLSYNQGGTNHTFFASPDICGDCHSPRLRAEDVQNSIQFLLDEVQDLIMTSGYTIDLDGEATLVDVNDIAEIEFGETHGRQGITVVIVDGTRHGPYSMNDVTVFDGATELGELYDFADPELIKAGWNWNLINNDGSLGVHNPLFAADALSSARTAMVTALTRSALSSGGAAQTTRSAVPRVRIRLEEKREIKRDLLP